MTLDLSVVIPLLNEEEAITKVLDDHIQALSTIKDQISGYEILCLDDASTDHSWEILQKYSQRYPEIRLLRHTVNQGITASFNHLFVEARGRWIYLTAGDGQWPAENLPALFHEQKRSGADLVVGVRQGRQEVYNFWRRCLSYGFNALARLCLGVNSQDANGIKYGRKEIFVEPLVSKSFFAEVERLFLAQRRGYSIVTAPVSFIKRASGKEKGARLKNLLWTISDLLRYVIFRPRSIPVNRA